MFEYATGLINVLEKKVFDKLDQERMLKAPSEKEAFEVLFDTDMAETASKENNLENIFRADTFYLKKVLYEMLCNRKEYFWFLFLRFDALNLKIALKKIWLEQEQITPPFSFAIEPYERLQALVSAKRSQARFAEELNKYVIEMAEGSINLLAEYKTEQLGPEAIESIVDKSYLETKLNLACSLNNFLKKITRLEIDIANIKALLSETAPRAPFIKGGNLTIQELEDIIELEEGEILMGLKKFLEVFGLSLLFERYYKEHKDKKRLEADLNGFVSEKVFERERAKGMGIEKVLGFFQRKLNAQANIRLIMFAKEHNLVPARIEPLLLPL